MKVMTCNIRCYGADDGADNWVHRKGFCAEVIRSRSPQVVCVQEMWAEQFVDLAAALPEYEVFGIEDEPLSERPMNSIFYLKEVFRRVSAGGYWLSETPHVSGSSSWESRCVRLANWVRLEERASGMTFRVVNTHLDHIGQPARENQARCIVEDAAAYPEEYPQVLTGDLNCDGKNAAITTLRGGGWKDSYEAVHGTDDPGHTFHGFKGPAYESTVGKMDWVFVRGNVAVKDAEVIRDSEGGRFPSDHYFVAAEIEIGGAPC
ncbi:MAG: endonuclease/exonuclease/phosphatase family protein [bacterium]|nr:endonuclease/exonuclease/phosphatase family protein [bacterium]